MNDGALRWKRTLVVTSIAQAFSIIGFSFVVPFLPLYIQTLGIHGTGPVTLWAAFLSGGTAIFMAISAPVWGVLADRHGRKIMVVRACLSAALLIALMGLAQNVYQLLVLRMLQGAFTGTVSASQALVSAVSPRDRLGFNLGVMQTAVFVGTSVGPLSGGVVADAVGYRLSFVAAGALLFVGGLVVMLFVEEEQPQPRDKHLPKTNMLTGIRQTLRAPALLPMIGAFFVVQFGMTVVFPVLPQFIQLLQTSGQHVASVTGLIFAVSGLAGAIASVTVGYFSDRFGYKAVLVVAAAIGAVLSIPQFFVDQIWQIAILRVGIGVALGGVLPSASALIASLVPSEQRGTAYGLAGSATSIGFAAGPLTAAAVVDIWGIRSVFLAAAVLIGFIAIWVGYTVHVPDHSQHVSAPAYP